jgi:hypothetical protein
VPNFDRIAQRTDDVDLEKGARLEFSICFLARLEASLVSRGKSLKKRENFSLFQRNCGGNCQRIGPSLWRSASKPEAKKLATGAFTSRNRFIWVM